MTLQLLQKEIAEIYKQRGYVASAQTLLLGAMEELGEVTEIVLAKYTLDYVPSAEKRSEKWIFTHSVAHEIGDCITYLLALCNKLGIEPEFQWRKMS